LPQVIRPPQYKQKKSRLRSNEIHAFVSIYMDLAKVPLPSRRYFCCNVAVYGTSEKVGAMVSREYFERTATSVATLDRAELTKRIRNFRGRFKLDFTEDYLKKLSVDRLRHILLAAMLNARPSN
jgi:hypothetical protein